MALEPIFDTGMSTRDLLTDPDFRSRQKIVRDPVRNAEALQVLAQVFAETPEIVLQKLVDVAATYCGADSAGISLEEKDAAGVKSFRWVAISGSFAPYLNGRTPRDFSPCGTCLDTGKPQLYTVTKPFYDFLGVTAEEIEDGILIPWEGETLRGTLWAIAHHNPEAFCFDDYLLLRSLADFALIAIRHHQQQEMVQRAVETMARAEMANRLAHQINNPLQCLTNSLYIASGGGEYAAKYLQQAVDDLAALSGLVKQLLSLGKASAASSKECE